MKTVILNMAIAAVSVAAQPHAHDHGRLHVRSPVEARAENVVYETAMATKYVLAGNEVDAEDAKKGLENGFYIVAGETTPTYHPPPPPSSTHPTSSIKGAAFLEQAYATSAKESATPIATSSHVVSYPTSHASYPSSHASYLSSHAPPTPSIHPASPKNNHKGSSSSGGYSTGGSELTAEFPDGELSCDFPSSYGAMAVPWLGTDGWATIQKCPSYEFGASKMISEIVTGIEGDGCTSGSFCSYACPAGYVKTQWPSAQGSTGQSIGGLYCDNGKLRLTRPEKKVLCAPGCGGVTVKNEMSEQLAICRTDYPGNEAMVIPLSLQPGSSSPLANVDSSDYYTWQGKDTTLQYYINPAGLSAEKACLWNSPSNPKDAGNWAPLNIGVGKSSSDGNTYLSIFPNWPTTKAVWQGSISITGASTACTYKNGHFSNGDPKGCTVTIGSGQQAVIAFSD